MSAVVTDTHAAIWYLVEPQLLSTPATAALDGAAAGGQPIYVSCIPVVEILYLVEKGRLPSDVWSRVNAALDDPTSPLAAVPLDMAIARTMESIVRSLVLATSTALPDDEPPALKPWRCGLCTGPVALV